MHEMAKKLLYNMNNCFNRLKDRGVKVIQV